jgi:cation transport protein ChaC
MPSMTKPPAVFPSPLDAAARAESLRQTLADDKASEPLWLFAYGSLIWDPCFTSIEHFPATLPGYRRAFNFWSVRARGTRERPGLGLGLEAEGTCDGIAYRLAEDTRAEDLDAIWRREMFGSVYEPHWLRLTTPQGSINALSFVTKPSHPQYAGDLSPGDTARIIAHAVGENGTCRDYLEQTIRSLACHGITDPAMEALRDMVGELSPER